ncbi:hypothetical protein [Deinococcus maricopensis]|uniref:Spermine synthase n=1 Tax=Deinococcus maricopensis (strain DSM 21211 / LMG 22137 / NRRL B-23946 / LB-34) TaxID=709986 RepID=E8UAR7_DEIML|nr:hypothetical protein [Deinococcus maricopensis]ADV68156.1 spermine synthase [Deinococcus maricopensis DSM 21211]
MTRLLSVLLGAAIGALLAAALSAHALTPEVLGAFGAQRAKTALSGAVAGLILSQVWRGRPRARGAGWVWQPLAAGVTFVALLAASWRALAALEGQWQALHPPQSRTVDVLIITSPASPAELAPLALTALAVLWLIGLPFMWRRRRP